MLPDVSVTLHSFHAEIRSQLTCAPLLLELGWHGWLVCKVLASHQGDPGSIPGPYVS